MKYAPPFRTPTVRRERPANALRASFLPVACMALGLLCTAVAQNATPEPAPRLVCDAPEHNFGEVDERAVIRHTFVLRNAGTARLEIKHVKPACGCTVAKLSSDTLDPGQTATLKSKLTLAGRRGVQQKSIRIESNDPVNPNVTLYLKGTVFREVDLDPPFIHFGDVLPDKAKCQEIKLVARDATVAITGASCESPKVNVEMLRDTDGVCRRLAVSTVPPVEPGVLSVGVTVQTNHRDMPEVHLRVSGTTLGEVTLIPKYLVLRKATQAAIRRVIYLRAGTASEYRVLQVQTPFPKDKVVVRKQSKTLYRIELNDLVAEPELDGQVIRILTDLERAKVLEVPIRVLP